MQRLICTFTSVETFFSFLDYRKENKEYEFCSECGQLHSADEDTNDESDNELCPDCGVPHNPFKHPPSPSSKVCVVSFRFMLLNGYKFEQSVIQEISKNLICDVNT